MVVLWGRSFKWIVFLWYGRRALFGYFYCLLSYITQICEVEDYVLYIHKICFGEARNSLIEFWS
jgi:hypothetical protein